MLEAVVPVTHEATQQSKKADARRDEMNFSAILIPTRIRSGKERNADTPLLTPYYPAGPLQVIDRYK